MKRAFSILFIALMLASSLSLCAAATNVQPRIDCSHDYGEPYIEYVEKLVSCNKMGRYAYYYCPDCDLKLYGELVSTWVVSNRHMGPFRYYEANLEEYDDARFQLKECTSCGVIVEMIQLD